MSDAGSEKIAGVGLMINRLPRNAPITINACGIFTFSFNIKALNIIAKNGDILLSIEASDSTR
ncbi:Uncharacterised protein [Dorea longicatena]|nr:Uncharacterised protein [Dorea longicatena]